MAVFETVLAITKVVGGDVGLARDRVADFLRLARIEMVDIGAPESALALDAFARFGKGRHPARLNMGDCFAYACAKTNDARLLYKGDDFARTDLA